MALVEEEHLSNNDCFSDVDFSQRFCNKDNISSCLNYLNQELVGHGMSSLYINVDDFDMSHLINSMYELLQRMRRSVALRDSLEESKHRALCEVEQLKIEKKRLKVKLESMERELNQSKNRIDTLVKEVAEKEIKRKAERDAVRCLQAMLRSREAQFIKTIKRDENEMNGLRERLGSLLSDRGDRKSGFDASESLSRFGGKRQQRSTTGAFKDTTTTLEEKQTTLRLENDGLRNDLRHFCGQLLSINVEYSVRNETIGDENRNLDATFILDSKIDSFNHGNSEMPFPVNRDGLMKKIREELSKIRRKFEQPHLIVKRQTLKDRNIFPNTKSQPSRKIITVPKKTRISSLNTTQSLRPKSALPSRVETKAPLHRSKSSLSTARSSTQQTNKGKHYAMSRVDRANPPLREIRRGNDDDDDEDEDDDDDGSTKTPRRLIRSGSYTIIRDQASTGALVVDLDFDGPTDETSQDSSISNSPPSTNRSDENDRQWAVVSHVQSCSSVDGYDDYL